MSTFLFIAIPMIAVGIVLLALNFRKKNLGFLIPGCVFLASGLVNVVIGASLGG